MLNSKGLWRGCAVLLLLVAAFKGAAADQKVQSVRPVPVPKELLDGTRLILKAAGCSLEMPATGWNWMMVDKAEPIFLCLNPKTFDMLVITTSTMNEEMTAHQPESLVKNARLTTEARGGKIVGDKFEMIDLPNAKKAAHVTFQEQLNGTKYAYIYLAQTADNVLLKLHITAPDKPAEPAELKKLANSIKLLAAAPAPMEKK